MSVVVIGKTSFLARSVRERLGNNGWLYLTHDEALSGRSWIENAACVVNFALHPALKTDPYREAADIDLQLARMIASHPAHYIMASSRLVYGHDQHHFNLGENHSVNPEGVYGRNKLVTERNLLLALPRERLTILRLANVFGHEIHRSLFFGRMLTRLKEQGKIIFNMSPESLRDFFAVWHLADALQIIAARPHGGIFNLGSGFGTACGDIADGVIEGYGSGRLDVLDHNLSDQYWLDITKARTAWPDLPVITPEILRHDCIDCGQWLRGLRGN